MSESPEEAGRPLRTPPLTVAQRDALATHTQRIEGRTDLARESREFLVELRKLMLISEATQERLAERIAENARRSDEAQSDTALPGHTRDGNYSSSNMSDELLGRGQLPRDPTVDALAELYVENVGRPRLGEVRAALYKMRAAAAKAQQRFEDDREDAAIDRGRAPGGLTYRRLRAARDQARADAESFRQRLEELEAASSVDKSEIDRLTDEGQALQRKVDALTEQVLQRDDQLTSTELQLEEKSQQHTGAVARIDQLESEVAELNTEVADLRDRLGRSWLQRFRQQASESGQSSSEPREQGRHRLDPDDEEITGSAASEGDHTSGGSPDDDEEEVELGGGDGGVGLQQLTEPERVRSRPRRLIPRAAVAVLVLAGLVAFAAKADVWPGAKTINPAFEGCVSSHGLAAEAGAVYPRTLFQVVHLASTPPRKQYYVIETPNGMTKGSVTFATSAQEAVQTIHDFHAFYSYYSIRDRQFTVRNTVVVDPSSDDGTGSLLTECVLSS